MLPNIEDCISRLKTHFGITSDKELADKLGLSAANLCNYKNVDNRLFPYKWMISAAIQFGLSIDWLLFGDDRPKYYTGFVNNEREARFFTFNFVARRYIKCGDKLCTRESMADEIHIESNNFPSKDEILTSINEAFENLEDVTITHKFEYKDAIDFSNYVGDKYIKGTL